MKILLVCSAGMSTDILRGELIKYAKGTDSAGSKGRRGTCLQGMLHGYDVILLGPQIAYRRKRLRRSAEICRCLPLRRGTMPREMPHTYWNR